jgi:hypothetical protein
MTKNTYILNFYNFRSENFLPTFALAKPPHPIPLPRMRGRGEGEGEISNIFG